MGQDTTTPETIVTLVYMGTHPNIKDAQMYLALNEGPNSIISLKGKSRPKYPIGTKVKFRTKGNDYTYVETDGVYEDKERILAWQLQAEARKRKQKQEQILKKDADQITVHIQALRKAIHAAPRTQHDIIKAYVIQKILE